MTPASRAVALWRRTRVRPGPTVPQFWDRVQRLYLRLGEMWWREMPTVSISALVERGNAVDAVVRSNIRAGKQIPDSTRRRLMARELERLERTYGAF